MGTRLAGMFGKHHPVLIGSRSADKAREAAAQLKVSHAEGMLNAEVAERSDVLFLLLSGPLEERHNTLKALSQKLAGKIIVDCTNVMYFYDETKWGQVCSTEQNAVALGVPARWVSAFKTNFFVSLAEPVDQDGIPRDVLVCSDDQEAKGKVMKLINETGFRAVDCGELKNTRIVELMGPPFIFNLDRSNLGGKMMGAWRFR